MVEKFQTYLDEIGEVGMVRSIVDPIVLVDGLPGVHIDEFVVFESGMKGLVLSIKEDFVEVIVFSQKMPGHRERVIRTNSSISIPVSESLLGNVIDALGVPTDLDAGKLETEEMRQVNVHPSGISGRKEISRPFETGVSVVDLVIPLGMGQRELVIGDRKTGKTQFLLQTMLNQAKKDTVCIYAAIGKRRKDILNTIEFINKNKISHNVVILHALGGTSLGEIYISPYSAMTIAEYFRDKGRDVLLILDDLTSHAKYYREMSLVAKKFPGRASYPGDIFYLHSKLLERAGNFIIGENKYSSITCLPVADAIEGDISGYIQTNLMSITDGHLFFDKEMFMKGSRPAINYFLSVTRVGRQTQSKLRWGLNRELDTFLSLYDKTQNFIHFGAELSQSIKTTLNIGEKILSFFNQSSNRVLSINLQIILFCMIWVGAWSDKSSTAMKIDVEKFSAKYNRDEAFKNKIDNIVNNSSDFNTLLGEVRANISNLLSGDLRKIGD